MWIIHKLTSPTCDPMDCSPPGSSVHGDSPGKNTGVGCCALLQGTFPMQGLKPGLPHCWQILYHLSHQGSPILETKWKIQHVDNAETKETLKLRSEPYSTIIYICLPHLMEIESKQLLPIPGWGKRSGRSNVNTWERFLKKQLVFILICSWRSLAS